MLYRWLIKTPSRHDSRPMRTHTFTHTGAHTQTKPHQSKTREKRDIRYCNVREIRKTKRYQSTMWRKQKVWRFSSSLEPAPWRLRATGQARSELVHIDSPHPLSLHKRQNTQYRKQTQIVNRKPLNKTV